MSARMKKPPIDDLVSLTIHGRHRLQFRVPRKIARGVLKLVRSFEVAEMEELVPAEEVFKTQHKKYGAAGSILRGLRAREELTQVELAKKIQVPQADISQIENGKRPIGKKIARRLAEVFGTDYRVFL